MPRPVRSPSRSPRRRARRRPRPRSPARHPCSRAWSRPRSTSRRRSSCSTCPAPWGRTRSRVSRSPPRTVATARTCRRAPTRARSRAKTRSTRSSCQRHWRSSRNRSTAPVAPRAPSRGSTPTPRAASRSASATGGSARTCPTPRRTPPARGARPARAPASTVPFSCWPTSAPTDPPSRRPSARPPSAARRRRRPEVPGTASGLFLTFEGGDGSGKSTQSALLTEWLSQQGRTVVHAREPGGTELGLELREIILHRRGYIAPRAEALIYAADRAHNVATVVRPALERGDIVIQDRYLDSSVAYQGAGRVLEPAEVRDVSLWATEHLLPDLTILLDLD